MSEIAKICGSVSHPVCVFVIDKEILIFACAILLYSLCLNVCLCVNLIKTAYQYQCLKDNIRVMWYMNAYKNIDDVTINVSLESHNENHP